jgi:putative DNA primase/helicase
VIQVSRWGAREVGDRRHLRDNEELRGLLNCGHTRDPAFVVRLVGDDFTPRRFTVWGAKALAGIGHLADTVMDQHQPRGDL